MSDQGRSGQQPQGHIISNEALAQLIDAQVQQSLSQLNYNETLSSPIKVENNARDLILPRSRNTSTPNIRSYNVIQAASLAAENNEYYFLRMLENFNSVKSIIDAKAIMHSLKRKYDTSKLELRKELDSGWEQLRLGNIDVDEFIIFMNSMSTSPPTKYSQLN